MTDHSKDAVPEPRKQPKPRPATGDPTDGPEAQQRCEKMQHQEKAEGDRREDGHREKQAQPDGAGAYGEDSGIGPGGDLPDSGDAADPTSSKDPYRRAMHGQGTGGYGGQYGGMSAGWDRRGGRPRAEESEQLGTYAGGSGSDPETSPHGAKDDKKRSE